MKKILFSVLMLALFVVPSYALENILDTTMEVDLKVGVGLNSALESKEAGQSSFDEKSDVDMPFAVAADFYYYNPEFKYIALGLGVSNLFNSKIDKTEDGKIGFTNLYLAVKAKYDLKEYSSIFDNIYLLINGGYGLVSLEPKESYNVDNGFYGAAGLGTEIKGHFIIEVLYAVNYAKIRDITTEAVSAYDADIDLMYTKIMLNIGYKFSF